MVWGISSVSITDENCGDATGAIDITVAGGTSPYTYSWSNGATTEDISGLAGGTYILTLTDATSCSMTQSFTVNNNTGGMVVTYVSSDETCGNADGGIDVTVTGGTAPYTFNWSTGDTSEDLINLTAGTYSCDVTDGVGCTLTIIATVNNQEVEILDTTIVDEVCSDGTGSIFVNAGNGVGSLMFTTGHHLFSVVHIP